MSDQIRWLRNFHRTLNFGSRENLKDQQSEARRIYKALTHDEVRALLEEALADADPKQRYLRHVLPCLACFQPGSLNRFHDRLIENRVFYPGVIYHAATDDVSRRLLPLIAQSTNPLTLNHLLLALAWTGNEVAVSSFAAWRRARPVWSSKLHVPPHEYTEQAGWELTSADRRRDLFCSVGFPLVVLDKDIARNDQVAIGAASEITCHWCSRHLVAILDFDLTAPAFQTIAIHGKRLRILTCEVCGGYGDMMTTIDLDGGAAWHGRNVRPAYLPDNDSLTDGKYFPEMRLAISSENRHFLESADWLIPGVTSSQLGGLPTWIQDSSYPTCPSCSRKMPFIAQISLEDCMEFGEGIFYSYLCRDCGIAATNYQQS